MKCHVYLGTHMPNWLEWSATPLFISHRRLVGRKKLWRARTRWALDSGGFSELQLYGRWVTTPEAYVAAVRRYRQEIGNLDWAAIQDWMCEPPVINGLVERRKPGSKRKPAIDTAAWKRWARGVSRAGHRGIMATLARTRRLERAGHEVEIVFHGTGLSVEEHQRRTVESYMTLKRLAPEIDWTPVVQGWTERHYDVCMEMFDAAGIDLIKMKTVGLGSICRRQHTDEAERVVRKLAGMGLRLHGFGFKVKGLLRVADVLTSSDSLAWSFDARRSSKLPGCTGHKNCANCPRYAMRWLSELHVKLGRPSEQLALPFAA